MGVLQAEVTWCEQDLECKRGVYALETTTGSGRVIYIGLSYARVKARIQNRVSKRTFRTGTVRIRGGNLTKKRLEDVERALIHAVQPRDNENKRNHGPRWVLQVINLGERGELPASIGYDETLQAQPPLTGERQDRIGRDAGHASICGAQTLAGVACLRQPESGAKRCWQHRGKWSIGN